MNVTEELNNIKQRLDALEGKPRLATNELDTWLTKTEWVQERGAEIGAKPGQHRADAIFDYVSRLEKEVADWKRAADFWHRIYFLRFGQNIDGPINWGSPEASGQVEEVMRHRKAAEEALRAMEAAKPGAPEGPSRETGPEKAKEIVYKPQTFEADGYEWIRHTPGSRMPCYPSKAVRVFMETGEKDTVVSRPASYFDWETTEPGKRVLGWLPAEVSRKQSTADTGHTPPATFEFAGYYWTRHTPGDPMPCDGEDEVNVLLESECTGRRGYTHHTREACAYNWGDLEERSIVGWRTTE